MATEFNIDDLEDKFDQWLEEAKEDSHFSDDILELLNIPLEVEQRTDEDGMKIDVFWGEIERFFREYLVFLETEGP